ncbi:MAG: hypothetical protein WBN72_06180 [Nitrososphaeraceae archaeon]
MEIRAKILDYATAPVCYLVVVQSNNDVVQSNNDEVFKSIVGNDLVDITLQVCHWRV